MDNRSKLDKDLDIFDPEDFSSDHSGNESSGFSDMNARQVACSGYDTSDTEEEARQRQFLWDVKQKVRKNIHVFQFGFEYKIQSVCES